MIDNIPCFLAKHNISQEEFEKTGLCWQVLNQIFNDYVTKKRTFEEHARNITNLINEGLHESIHSTKFRIKDPDHLIAKIIRKKLSSPKRSITLQNYETEVTDLIGIRILHLFKDDWQAVHEFIIRNWKLKEKFTANVRQGDNTDNFKKQKAKINIHKAGYRSVHYLIKHPIPNKKIIAEVQVRTIFEEAWSEIDHKIRYPDNLDNTILSEYLVVFNRLAGSADEMGSYINLLVKSLKTIEISHQQELVHRDEVISNLNNQVEKLTAQINRLKISNQEKLDISATLSEISEKTKLVKETQLGSWASLENNTIPNMYNYNASLHEALKNIIGDKFSNLQKDYQERNELIANKLTTDAVEKWQRAFQGLKKNNAIDE